MRCILKQQILTRAKEAIVTLQEGETIGAFRQLDKLWLEADDFEISDVVFLSISPEVWVLGAYLKARDVGHSSPLDVAIKQINGYLNTYLDHDVNIASMHQWEDSLPLSDPDIFGDELYLDYFNFIDKHYWLLGHTEIYTFGMPLRITNPRITVVGNVKMEKIYVLE